MVKRYQPFIYTGKNLGGKCHINPGTTVYPWGGASDLRNLGLISAATIDGRISYIFARDMQPATWIHQDDWPTVKWSFQRRQQRVWCDGKGFLNEVASVWCAYAVDPIRGHSSQYQRLDLIAFPWEWDWEMIENTDETICLAKQVADEGFILINKKLWKPTKVDTSN